MPAIFGENNQMNFLFLPLFLFGFVAIATAQTSPPAKRSFSHTLETQAAPADIWHWWTDIEHWQDWDTGLQSAVLTGPFAQGTKGVLLPDKGPKARFTITAYTPGVSYAFATQLPLGKLVVERTLHTDQGKTFFTHTVSFQGLSAPLFYRILGKRYRQMLPPVMEKLRELAEKGEVNLGNP